MVRLNIIAGFLGSGKTTAIRWILDELAHTEKIALLVNEFGKLDIDGSTLRRGQAVRQINLPSGCICCELKGSLALALEEIQRTEQPDRLIIEPTGIAVPKDIASIAQRDSLSNHYEIMALTAMADPRIVIRMAEKKVPFFWEQLHQVSQIVLNKCDLASADELAQTRDLFKRELLNYEVFETNFGRFPLDWLNRSYATSMPKEKKKDIPAASKQSDATSNGNRHAQGTSLSFTLPSGILQEKRIRKLFKLLQKGLYGFTPWRAKALLLLEAGPTLINLTYTGEIALEPANPIFNSELDFNNRIVIIAEKFPTEAQQTLITDFKNTKINKQPNNQTSNRKIKDSTLTLGKGGRGGSNRTPKFTPTQNSPQRENNSNPSPKPKEEK